MYNSGTSRYFNICQLSNAIRIVVEVYLKDNLLYSVDLLEKSFFKCSRKMCSLKKNNVKICSCLLKGVCHEIFDLHFFNDLNP